MLDYFKDAFSTAKLVALVAHDNLTKEWYHIFSVIELLPNDISKYNIPNKEWYNNHTIRSDHSNSKFDYSFSLVVEDLESIDQAMQIFNSPYTLQLNDGTQIVFYNNSFVQEPNGKSPLLIQSNLYSQSGLSAVLPKRNCSQYALTKIDNERQTSQLFIDPSSDNSRQISQLTSEWLGFDLAAYPEHIGNMYLVAANPYFRQVDFTLSTNPVGIIYNVNRRRDVIEPIDLRIVDLHGEAIAFDKTFLLNEKTGIIELPHDPHFIEASFYNSSGNLIEKIRPFNFIKQISIQSSIKSATLNVKVSEDKTFSIDKFASQSPINVGQKDRFNAPYYFKAAEQQRNNIVNKKNHEFIFFPGAKEPGEKTKRKQEAKEIIRNLINRSKDTCYLCDPYFNVSDLMEYAFHTKDNGVKIRILNCKGSSFVNKEKASLLLSAIIAYNSQPFGKIECRMLRGDSILHDRFVLSDQDIWFIGSSFSEFGNRATCIAKVPKGSDTEILREVENWYYNKQGNFSQSLEEYVNSTEADA